MHFRSVVRSVQFKFFLILLPAMLLALLISYTFAVYSANLKFDQELELKRNSLKIYPAVFAEPVWNFKTMTIRSLQQSMLLDPNIVLVEVFDESNNLLHSEQSNPDQESEIAFTFEAPIIYQNAHIRQTAGTLRVVVSNASLVADKNRHFQDMLVLLGLVVLALSASVAIIQFRIFGGPIKQLHYAIRCSKNKVSFTKVTQAPNNELGDIINAFNEMQEEIQLKHQDLESSEKRFRTLYHATPALLFTLSRSGIITDASQYFLSYLGYQPEHVIGKKISELFNLSSVAGKQLSDRIWTEGKLNKHPLSIATGREEVLNMQLDVELPSSAQDQGALAVMTDVTRLKQAHLEIAHQARTDSLSGQPNRYHFQQQLSSYIQNLEAREAPGDQLAVMFLDLDRFKSVNDTFGHATGDQLIRVAGQRIADCIRPGDMLARLGGDEFSIILQDASHQACKVVTERILNSLENAFHLADSEIFVSGSVGIALYPTDAKTPDSLLQLADIAMYRAKHNGGGYSFYIPEKEESAKHRLTVEKQLRQCLNNDSLVLHYQPIINLASGTICGAEALLRLKAADGSLIYPDQFISRAEETGLIIPIGLWCIKQACKQLAQWQHLLSDDFYLSVNLSPRQLQSTQFLPELKQALADNNIAPETLVLEITESLLIHDNHNNQRIIQEIDNTGCQIAIDDFGTGYSALSYLMNFPVDILKIDRSFIHNCVENETSRNLVNAILNLSKSLNLRVITEGIETEEQLNLIQQAGSEAAQGYYFSRPVPAQELTENWHRLQLNTANKCTPELAGISHAHMPNQIRKITDSKPTTLNTE